MVKNMNVHQHQVYCWTDINISLNQRLHFSCLMGLFKPQVPLPSLKFTVEFNLESELMGWATITTECDDSSSI